MQPARNRAATTAITRRGSESRSLALVPAARKAPASFSPWRAKISWGLRTCYVISTLVGLRQDRRWGLVRQANWQKVGGASPPERRSNRTTFLREPCVGSREGAGEASVVDADLRAYFDTIPRDWLITFLEHIRFRRNILH